MTLTLRPHHVLCRLGFVGYGYSPDFINEMGRIASLLASGKVKTVILKPGFDNVCRSCPHHEGECSPEHLGRRGQAAADFDLRTLRALKLKLGHPYPLPEINQRIAALTPEAFADICRGCEWQALHNCQDGYARLRQQFFPEKTSLQKSS